MQVAFIEKLNHARREENERQPYTIMLSFREQHSKNICEKTKADLLYRFDSRKNTVLFLSSWLVQSAYFSELFFGLHHRKFLILVRYEICVVQQEFHRSPLSK